MSDQRWSEAIDRMLTRVRDTSSRVRSGFPHWADPDTGEWTTTPDGDWTGGYYYLFESLLALAGRLDPLGV